MGCIGRLYYLAALAAIFLIFVRPMVRLCLGLLFAFCDMLWWLVFVVGLEVL